MANKKKTEIAWQLVLSTDDEAPPGEPPRDEDLLSVLDNTADSALRERTLHWVARDPATYQRWVHYSASLVQVESLVQNKANIAHKQGQGGRATGTRPGSSSQAAKYGLGERLAQWFRYAGIPTTGLALAAVLTVMILPGRGMVGVQGVYDAYAEDISRNMPRQESQIRLQPRSMFFARSPEHTLLSAGISIGVTQLKGIEKFPFLSAGKVDFYLNEYAKHPGWEGRELFELGRLLAISYFACQTSFAESYVGYSGDLIARKLEKSRQSLEALVERKLPSENAVGCAGVNGLLTEIYN